MFHGVSVVNLGTLSRRRMSIGSASAPFARPFEAGDVAAVRKLAKARQELVNL